MFFFDFSVCSSPSSGNIRRPHLLRRCTAGPVVHLGGGSVFPGLPAIPCAQDRAETPNSDEAAAVRKMEPQALALDPRRPCKK